MEKLRKVMGRKAKALFGVSQPDLAAHRPIEPRVRGRWAGPDAFVQSAKHYGIEPGQARFQHTHHLDRRAGGLVAANGGAFDQRIEAFRVFPTVKRGAGVCRI